LSLDACGFALASKGHDTRAIHASLGHKTFQPTVRYNELSHTSGSACASLGAKPVQHGKRHWPALSQRRWGLLPL